MREFGDVLYEVVESVWPRMSDKDRRSLARMLSIWEDRSLFPSAFIRSLKKIADVSTLPTAKREEPSTPPGSPPKKQKRDEAKSQADDATKAVLSHPVVQALTELEKHRAGKKEEENVKRMFETATKNMSEEQALGMFAVRLPMGITTANGNSFYIFDDRRNEYDRFAGATRQVRIPY